VAFEMARQLQAENVALLALFDSYPPSAFRQETAADADTRFLTLFLWTTTLYSGKEPRASAGDLERIEPGSRLDYVLDEIRHSGAWPPGVSGTEARGFFKLWQNLYRSLQNYSPPPGYSGGLTLFRATGKPPQPLLDLERTSAVLAPADWQRLVAGPVEIRDVPGNHYTLFNEPQVRILAEQLRPFLEGRYE
jgi:thioesterase domain-containing protein